MDILERLRAATEITQEAHDEIDQLRGLLLFLYEDYAEYYPSSKENSPAMRAVAKYWEDEEGQDDETGEN